LESSCLDLGEFRSEPIVLRLLLRGPRIIREGDVRCLEGIFSQIVHFPLAPHEPVSVVILGELVPLLADAGDVVRRAGVRAVLLARLVVVVSKDNVVLNRRRRGVEDQLRVIDSLPMVGRKSTWETSAWDLRGLGYICGLE